MQSFCFRFLKLNSRNFENVLAMLENEAITRTSLDINNIITLSIVHFSKENQDQNLCMLNQYNFQQKQLFIFHRANKISEVTDSKVHIRLLMKLYTINNKNQLMQYSRNVYQSRPPLQHTPHKSNNFAAQKQQNFILKSRQRMQDTQVTNGYVQTENIRRSSKSWRKNVYQNQNVDSIRRPKQYCPLSKVTTNMDEEVLKKSRDYVHSSQYNNYVNAIKSGSKSRDDLIQNMKKARTNNIYLPISEQEIHRLVLPLKTQQRRPIFSKSSNNNQNRDLFASFDLTIDHLSKIQEKETQIIERNNQQKENAYRAANLNSRSSKDAILIEDESDDYQKNRVNYKQTRNKTPELCRSPILTTSNRQTDNFLRFCEQNSLTKRKKTVIFTPTKNHINTESSVKFVDYEQVQWLKKREKCQSRTSKGKYQYLSKQNHQYQPQNLRSNKKPQKKPTANKTTESEFSSIGYQNSVPTTKTSSIYDVDFKLKRPTGNTQSQISFKRQKCIQRQKMKPLKKDDVSAAKQGSSYSRSHSKGKLSVITPSKFAHLH